MLSGFRSHGLERPQHFVGAQHHRQPARLPSVGDLLRDLRQATAMTHERPVVLAENVREPFQAVASLGLSLAGSAGPHPACAPPSLASRIGCGSVA